MVYESSENSNNVKRILNKKSYSFSDIVKEFNITNQSFNRIVLCLEALQRVFRHIEKLLSMATYELEIPKNYKRALTKVA